MGDACPRTIEVIPLVEDMESLAGIGRIVVGLWRIARPPYMRVFIARSDPAMNYGMVSAVILAKIALSQLSRFSAEAGIPIYPIVGVGSLPFRGHMSPENCENVLREYRGFWTFTIQSAFKYDYPEEDVKRAVDRINRSDPGEAEELSHEEARIAEEISKIYAKNYKLPERGGGPGPGDKLHSPLHAQEEGQETPHRALRLPQEGWRRYPAEGHNILRGHVLNRIPPEILGLSILDSLDEEGWRILESLYRGFRIDLRAGARYYSHESLSYVEEIWRVGEEVVGMLRRDLDFLENQLGIRPGALTTRRENTHTYQHSSSWPSRKAGRPRPDPTRSRWP